MPTARPAPALASALITLLVGCQKSAETTTSTTAAKPPPTPAVVMTTPPTAVATPYRPLPPVTRPASRPAAAIASQSTRPAVATTVTAITSAPATLDAVAAGRKTSTTRRGVRRYPIGPAVLVSGQRRVPIVITSIDVKRYAELSDDDATSNGSASLAEYRAALAHDYPDLSEDDRVSVVHFRRGG